MAEGNILERRRRAHLNLVVMCLGSAEPLQFLDSQNGFLYWLGEKGLAVGGDVLVQEALGVSTKTFFEWYRFKKSLL